MIVPVLVQCHRYLVVFAMVLVWSTGYIGSYSCRLYHGVAAEHIASADCGQEGAAVFRNTAGHLVDMAAGTEVSHSRRRWLLSDHEPKLTLINPPESRRVYSDSDGREDSSPRSVLGSLGTWKVASPSKDRWVSMDIGCVRRVYHILLQCGDLHRSFSGWVTRLRVECATSEHAWHSLGELPTGCGSKPLFEHRLTLRSPVWTRFVRLTPIEWKVAAALSTGEDLEPYISMRAAVLVSDERQLIAEGVRSTMSGPLSTDVTAPSACVDQPLMQRRRELLHASSRTCCLFNLSRGVDFASAAPLRIDRRLTGVVHLLPAQDAATSAARPPIAALRPGCRRGDCVLLEKGRMGVVTDVDADGRCTCLINTNSTHTQSIAGATPAAIIGEFDWNSRSFCMDDGPSPPAWAVNALGEGRSVVDVEVSLASRLHFNDEWLVADGWMDTDETCVVEVAPCSGSQHPTFHLTLRPTALAYAPSVGSRLALASPKKAQEACGTAVGLDATGSVVVAVDNTPGKAFIRWAASTQGKSARGILHPLVVDPRPTTAVIAPSIVHEPGTRIVVLHEGALVDVSVVAWAGARCGNRHDVQMSGSGECRAFDLNVLNHAVQRFTSAAAFDRVRAAYISNVIEHGKWVEDAITGRVLRIEDQLLAVTMASGEEAVQMSVADAAPEDLVWSLGANLDEGDRVRRDGRFGTVGFRNEDRVRVLPGSTEQSFRRYFCGRNHAGGICGGEKRDGSSPPCHACRRFVEENLPMLTNRAANTRLVNVEYDASDVAEGGASSMDEVDGKARRELLLAHELEKASPICGVHREEWNGCAFRNGDVVVVERGQVTHATTHKTVPLQHSYKPLPLSPLLNARSSTVEITQGHVAKRVHGKGGCVMGMEPLAFVNGEASFEVVIKRQSGSGNEGLEVGVTTTEPKDVSMTHRGYAASHAPSWFSSDSGSLWTHGRSHYEAGQWEHTRPTALAAGDVVMVTVTQAGALEISCNGVVQVRWSAKIPTDKPLYPLFGLRAPLLTIAVRQRDSALDNLPKRRITLRGIEGRCGEVIDLTKHGRPRLPAAFVNVRSLTDIRSLFPLLFSPWQRREQGHMGAQPILIRAAPGTGKTWAVMQCALFAAWAPRFA